MVTSIHYIILWTLLYFLIIIYKIIFFSKAHDRLEYWRSLNIFLAELLRKKSTEKFSLNYFTIFIITIIILNLVIFLTILNGIFRVIWFRKLFRSWKIFSSTFLIGTKSFKYKYLKDKEKKNNVLVISNLM